MANQHPACLIDVSFRAYQNGLLYIILVSKAPFSSDANMVIVGTSFLGLAMWDGSSQVI